MRNKRRLTYLAVFVVSCWAALAAIIGVFLALAHVLKSSAAGVILFFVVLYSCLFGVLGWQAYAFKSPRDGWPSDKARDHSRKGNPGMPWKDGESTDSEFEPGWKRSP